MPTAKQYYKWIWEYKKRKSKYEKKLSKKAFNAKSKLLNLKIYYWTYKLQLKKNTRKKLKEIGLSVKATTGKSPYMAYNKDKLSVSIFVTYCLDHKIPSLEIGEWIGLNDTKRVSFIRKNFKKTFKISVKNKEAYEYFLRHIGSKKKQKINQKQSLKQD